MTPLSFRPAELARELFEAERNRLPIEPLTDRYSLDLDSAYTVQTAYTELAIASGAQLVGHKIGAANVEIQRRFGLSEPDFGRLFDYMDASLAGSVSLDEVIQPHIEPEVAFVLGKALHGPGISAGDVMEATSEIRASFEVVDSRIKDYRVKVEDTIADNGSACRFLLGDQIDIDSHLASVTTEVSRNGGRVADGVGRAVLGSPANSVAWLANRIAEFGDSLEAGHVVLSGSLTGALPIERGDMFVATFGGGASVSCQFH